MLPLRKSLYKRWGCTKLEHNSDKVDERNKRRNLLSVPTLLAIFDSTWLIKALKLSLLSMTTPRYLQTSLFAITDSL